MSTIQMWSIKRKMRERGEKSQEADLLGGSEEDIWLEYEEQEEKQYYDKPDHLKRSARNQPNHNKIAKKKLALQEIPKVAS